ncbi:MAG: MerR family transcriptional regulator [Oscillospiraceae bacterium]|nr:MerR family transcriptional regulator [Oscillospiraceae bacterium]
MTYSIKQVAEKCSMKEHVLRYYEKEGLLPSVARGSGGARRYSADDLEWLSLVCCLKKTGMSIKQIREFVDLSKQGDATLADRVDMLRAHKLSVEEQMLETQAHLDKVSCKIAYYMEQYDAYADRAELG